MQLATRCDRWARDCDTTNAGKRRIRWRERVSQTLSAISSPRQFGKPARRGKYKATEEVPEVCPRYWEELRRISTPRSAAPTVTKSSTATTTVDDAATTPNLRASVLRNVYRGAEDDNGEVKGTTGITRSAGIRNLRGSGLSHAHHHDSDDCNHRCEEAMPRSISCALPKARTQVCAAARRVYTVGSNVARGVGGALDRATKIGWRKTRMKVAAGVRRVLKRSENNNNIEDIMEKGARIQNSSSSSYGPRRHLNQRHQPPASFSNAPGHKDRLLAANRALRGANAGALRLSAGLNTFVFALAGLRFYANKRRRVRRIPGRQWGRAQRWWGRLERDRAELRRQHWREREQGGGSVVMSGEHGGSSRAVSEPGLCEIVVWSKAGLGRVLGCLSVEKSCR